MKRLNELKHTIEERSASNPQPTHLKNQSNSQYTGNEKLNKYLPAASYYKQSHSGHGSYYFFIYAGVLKV